MFSMAYGSASHGRFSGCAKGAPMEWGHWRAFVASLEGIVSVDCRCGGTPRVIGAVDGHCLAFDCGFSCG